MTTRGALLFFLLVSVAALARNADAAPSGKAEYLANCARCHGVDGKGHVPEMSAAPGYISVDLTQLSKGNDGHFPSSESL